ncbi:DUF2306 domain-containing protein [Aquimarina sp. RZ0]|uniref:DUF2306 domain-containing protein n=1 Tax=Aquimarina sp. RZ0 TaxID=2607730 RepID=UPI0011F2A981|nr:DUF2306 domain-containing protein [Aquimarina sp. RZ0]KAA1247876.1 DUF2306 domain-containing protein [Aquimarina sp. RZ0]
MKRFVTIVFVLLSILVGLYPLAYFFVDRTFGLLASKNTELLSDTIWNIAFYIHIILSGIALLIGWIQFNHKVRIKKPKLHQLIGYIYVVNAIFGGMSGIYIGFFATGGIIVSLGFICLGVVWLYTTIKAYVDIKNGEILLHQKMMYYSYAACFAAVTLRIWLPILSISIGDFIIAYRIVAWLCWVPNLIVTYILISKNKIVFNLQNKK